ncbi:hypothetical protein MP631_08755 [Xanthomonas phaseoli pv. phaseoli]|nr:hypothetical protein MP631_08755 [Xanthomonas phaseoli pv. phaseoli]
MDKKFSAGGQAASNAAASASPPRRPSAQAATQAHGIKKQRKRSAFLKTLLGQRAFGLDEDVHARGDSMAWPWRAAMVGKKIAKEC